jgi:hypothetical protein
MSTLDGVSGLENVRRNRDVEGDGDGRRERLREDEPWNCLEAARGLVPETGVLERWIINSMVLSGVSDRSNLDESLGMPVGSGFTECVGEPCDEGG